jgi:hypothetical protein
VELSCPSCGTKHRTEDYPGAFDIQCGCGYSILVPDIDALQDTAPAPGFTTRSPTSEEENESPLRMETHTRNSIGGDPGFTPPEDLPKEMPYDPFEIPRLETAADSSLEVDNPFAMPASPKDPEPTPLPPPPARRPPPPSPVKATLSRPQPPAQALVERSQAASLGQLLGPSFDVEAGGLSREGLVAVSKRCQRLLKNRPWLETELRRRKIDLERIPDSPRIANLPEIVAVEFYMACAEAGGRCEFSAAP